MSAGTEGTEGNQEEGLFGVFLVLTSPYSFQNDWKTEDLLKCRSWGKSDKFSLCSFCHYLFCGLILSLFSRRRPRDLLVFVAKTNKERKQGGQFLSNSRIK